MGVHFPLRVLETRGGVHGSSVRGVASRRHPAGEVLLRLTLRPAGAHGEGQGSLRTPV